MELVVEEVDDGVYNWLLWMDGWGMCVKICGGMLCRVVA